MKSGLALETGVCVPQAPASIRFQRARARPATRWAIRRRSERGWTGNGQPVSVGNWKVDSKRAQDIEGHNFKHKPSGCPPAAGSPFTNASTWIQAPARSPPNRQNARGRERSRARPCRLSLRGTTALPFLLRVRLIDGVEQLLFFLSGECVVKRRF